MRGHDLVCGLVVVGAHGAVFAAAEAADAQLGQRAGIVKLGVHFAHGEHAVLVRAGQHCAAAVDRAAQPRKLVCLDARRRRGVVNADEKAHIVHALGRLERAVDKLKLALARFKVRGGNVLVKVNDAAAFVKRIVLHNVLYRQLVAAQLRPREHRVFAQGAVVLERVAVVADSRRKAHDRVDDPYLVLGRGQRGKQAFDKLRLRHRRAVAEGHVRAGEAARVDKSARQELVERQDVSVAARVLLLEHPLVQCRAVAVFKAAFAKRLLVQPRAVVLRVRHDKLVPERACQVLDPVRIHRPVVQRNIRNARLLAAVVRQLLSIGHGRRAACKHHKRKRSGQQFFLHSFSFF